MARHLAPDERAAIVARYQETANASEVAREFGVDEKTVRRLVTKSGSPRKAELHARAVDAALRAGRRALRRSTRVIARYLDEGAPDAGPLALEPADVARLVQAQRATVGGLVELDANRDRRKIARLTREKTRAEIALLEAKRRGEVADVVVLSPEDAARAARSIFGSPSALERGGAGPVAVEADALPVPDPVDR